MEQRLTRAFQIIVLGASAMILFILLLMLLRGLRPEWKTYQRQYRQKSGESKAAQRTKLHINQIILTDFDRIDRCTTCHQGVDDPRMEKEPPPFRTHSGDLLKQHPPEKFGCTICHGGQGQAVDARNAHATAADVHWDPLLSADHLQSSCGQCHLAIFSPSSFAGAPVFQHGRDIFVNEGCLGCHKARGVGGAVGPDLTEQGGKTRHEYDFSNVAGEKTVSNWLFNHFKDPEMVSPGSQMLAVDLAVDELNALVTFTMGLNKPDIPLDYFSVETLAEFKGKRHRLEGDKAFAMICSACHGKNGEGKSYTEYKMGVPGIGGQDFLAVASPEFIAFTLLNGRGGQMASWTPRFSGLKIEEIDALVNFVKSRRIVRSSMQETAAAKGDAERGRKLYSRHCLMCHGRQGDGAAVISLNNQDFLAAADDEFLYKTIVHGRGNTAMPAWGRFSSQEISDLITFLRTWQKASPRRIKATSQSGDVENGKQLYHYRCSRCHGLYGEGNSGPAIANADFLSAASDDYLHAIVAGGRRHTAMFGWSTLPDAEKLTAQQIADVVAFLRWRADNPPEVIYPGSSFGQAERGEKLFATLCSECHGANGEGTKAPALNNQEFLNSAANGVILATMSLGRENTPMPSWGRGTDKFRKLSIQERYDIVAFIRRWQSVVIKRGEVVRIPVRK